MKNRNLLQVRACLSTFVIIFVLNSCSSPKADEVVDVLPFPKQVQYQRGTLCIDDTIRVFSYSNSADTLVEVLSEDFLIMFDKPVIRSSSETQAHILLLVDSTLEKEEYQLEVASNIQLHAGSYQSLAMASATLLQLFDTSNQQLCIRQMSVRDQPDLPYRGLLIDVARRKHDFSTLKQVVRLCRWYKVNHLQIHLTDDQNFTFPSEKYPQLVTTDYHFTRDQLRELVEYAYARGIDIVPELDVPGHSALLVKNMPTVFGFKEKDINDFTIHMGRDTVYKVLDALIGEIASVFYRSKYIHIGGDEANFDRMAETKELAEFLAANNLNNIDQLYWHFLNQMNSFVRKRGKQTIVWEGFAREGNAVVDKSIVVMAWESIYQLPQDLLAGGYKIINVSWQPLYVVNNRKWSPEEIYRWNPYYWQNWVTHMPSYTPIQLERNDNVMGGSMASWDQPEYTEVNSLRKRVPAMVENVWNVKTANKNERFVEVLNALDKKLNNYLSPIDLKVSGLTHPEITDGLYDEQTWFDSSVTLTLSTPQSYNIRYTMDGSPVTHSSNAYTEPIQIQQTTLLRFQAFTQQGNPIGNAQVKYFEHRPVSIKLEANFPIHPDTLWKTTRDWLVPYSDSIKILILAKVEGEVRYSISRNDARTKWIPYQQPIVLSDTNIVKVEAALFNGNKQVGMTVTRHVRRE